jgi:hypothetical protein
VPRRHTTTPPHIRMEPKNPGAYVWTWRRCLRCHHDFKIDNGMGARVDLTHLDRVNRSSTGYLLCNVRMAIAAQMANMTYTGYKAYESINQRTPMCKDTFYKIGKLFFDIVECIAKPLMADEGVFDFDCFARVLYHLFLLLLLFFFVFLFFFYQLTTYTHSK